VGEVCLWIIAMIELAEFYSLFRSGGSRQMELNRNHYFAIGIVLVMLGAQLRLVDSFVLNEKASDFVVENFRKDDLKQNVATPIFMAAAGRAPTQTLQPPPWIGWALLSIGGVLVLHSLAMRAPGS